MSMAYGFLGNWGIEVKKRIIKALLNNIIDIGTNEKVLVSICYRFLIFWLFTVTISF
jgi:hypothetical protein